jgi:hypothetical protein
MKSRVVYASGVAQKGKAPKPLKPDEILTNQLYKQQCRILWRKLVQDTEKKAHNMVNRALYKRFQGIGDDEDSDDDAELSEEDFAPNLRLDGMEVKTTLTAECIEAGEKLRHKVSKRELNRLENAMLQKHGYPLLQQWFTTAQEESERYKAEKEEDEAMERRRTATLLIRRRKLTQIAVPQELLKKIQKGANQHRGRRFDFSKGKNKLNRPKYHLAARNSLQMATQVVNGKHSGFIHTFANFSEKAFDKKGNGDIVECRRVLLRHGYVHKANFVDADGVFDEQEYASAKEFAAKLKARSDDLRAAIYDKSEAKIFSKKKNHLLPVHSNVSTLSNLLKLMTRKRK